MNEANSKLKKGGSFLILATQIAKWSRFLVDMVLATNCVFYFMVFLATLRTPFLQDSMVTKKIGSHRELFFSPKTKQKNKK